MSIDPQDESADTDDPAPKPGDRIGCYILQKPLGRGVSCHVYRAWDEAKGIPVAMKIVNWDNVRNREAALKQLRAEAASLARIRHPRIVRFIDFGYDSRWPYLVLEFVEGRPLGEILREGGALPERWTLYLLGQMIEGLCAVWKAGIVHRDIKPDNVIVGATGIAKLIDFGLAKSDVLQNQETSPIAEIAGTAAYISPEQARNPASVDHRADMYSLGVTLYEMLTGRVPFTAQSRMQVILQHFTAPVVPPIEIVPQITPMVNDLCLWMLAKAVEDRPRTGDELRIAFDNAIRSIPPAPIESSNDGNAG